MGIHSLWCALLLKLLPQAFRPGNLLLSVPAQRQLSPIPLFQVSLASCVDPGNEYPVISPFDLTNAFFTKILCKLGKTCPAGRIRMQVVQIRDVRLVELVRVNGLLAGRYTKELNEVGCELP